MDRARAVVVGDNLKAIVANVNAITEIDLDELLAEGSREIAIGPLTDPTAWQSGGMFEVNRGTTKVLRALLAFKREVSGIGDFK